MKIRDKILLISGAAILLACAITVISLPRIALSALETAYGVEIKYDRIIKAGLDRLRLDHLTITDKARGVGISSKDATLRLSWSLPDPRRSTLKFDLREVQFVKHAAEPKASYDTLDGLVALPFGSRWTYSEISGKVRSTGDGVSISDFMAKSDLIRLAFNGVIMNDNTINADIMIYFSDSLTKNIPPELTKLVLTKEDPGWKSLAVKLEGNYNMPTIRVSSKLFRLSIGVKEGS